MLSSIPSQIPDRRLINHQTIIQMTEITVSTKFTLCGAEFVMIIKAINITSYSFYTLDSNDLSVPSLRGSPV